MMLNITIKIEKNCKYYRKCSNNFAIDCKAKKKEKKPS